MWAKHCLKLQYQYFLITMYQMLMLGQSLLEYYIGICSSSFIANFSSLFYCFGFVSPLSYCYFQQQQAGLVSSSKNSRYTVYSTLDSRRAQLATSWWTASGVGGNQKRKVKIFFFRRPETWLQMNDKRRMCP